MRLSLLIIALICISTVPSGAAPKADSKDRSCSTMLPSLIKTGVFVAVAATTLKSSQPPNVDFVRGKVVSKNWRHTATVETFQKVTQTAWVEEIPKLSPRMPIEGQNEEPGAEDIRNCRDELYRVEVCSAETTLTCEPVYRQKCDFNTYRWVYKTVARLGGEEISAETDKLPWPETTVGPNDRVILESYYELEVAYDWNSEPRSTVVILRTEEEFRKWNAGQQVSLEISPTGYVKSITP